MIESIEDDRIALLVLSDNRMETIAETKASGRCYFLRVHETDQLYLVARSEHSADYVLSGHVDDASEFIKEMTWDGNDRLEVAVSDKRHWNALPDENKPNPQSA